MRRAGGGERKRQPPDVEQKGEFTATENKKVDEIFLCVGGQVSLALWGSKVQK